MGTGGVAEATQFELGESVVTYTLSDGPNEVICSFTVTVVDEQAPIVNCPADIAESTDMGECNYTYAPTLDMGDADDNCSAFADLTITYTVQGPDNSLSGPFANGADYDFIPA